MNVVIDLLGVGLVLTAGWMGLQRGVLASLFKTAGLLGGYLAAFLYGPVLGRWLHAATGWPLVYCIAGVGMLALALILVLFGVAKRSLARSEHLREDAGYHRPQWLRRTGKVGGLAVGLVAGALLLITLVWLYSLARIAPWGQSWPPAGPTRSGAMTRHSVRRLARPPLAARLPEDTAARMADWISRPDEAAERIRRLMQQTAFDRLLHSETFRDDLLSGYAPAVKQNPDLRAVFEDPVIMEELYELGLLEDRSASDALIATLSTALARVGRRLDRVLEEPEFSVAIEEWREEELLTPARIPRLFLDARLPRLLDRLLAPDEEP